ncbi:MAG: flagella synthesis protein FlgN [Porticoccaceae bacterium]
MTESTVPAHPDRARLDDLIGAQLTATASLAEILEQECRALAGDVTALTEISAAKVGVLTRLERLHLEYRGLLDPSAEAGAGRDEARRHLERVGGDALVARWQRLEQLIDRCREANRANSVAIERSRRRVEQALAVVRGQARTPGLYGADGVSQVNDAGHMLARA